eukprot:gnl/TRDRNA2_/TRDRNA2_131162_c0_seq1.p1 gnl/TRDRNA2_/TRDRNA2_131162_c0~~gnl/TRDRNA2_/TRDRNA2_131162_c0_seq1.p1  ORF type:complete len:473 (-),score=68.63 gnl/TRDRNA2_/TRDRNA2_131162_c0_seq1:78-1496(-)
MANANADETTPLLPPGVTHSLACCVLFIWFSCFMYGFSIGLVNATLVSMDATFNLSSLQMGMLGGGPVFIVALAARGAGPLADWMGRRRLTNVGALAFLIGSIVWALADSFIVALIGRCLHGVGLGIGFVASSLYTAEVAPCRARGALGTSTEVMLNLGIITAWGLALLFSQVFNLMAPHDWRALVWSSGVLAFLCIPANWLLAVESPRWLMKNGSQEDAEETLRALLGTGAEAAATAADLRSEEKGVAEVDESQATATESKSIWQGLHGGLLRRPLLVSQGMGFFHHACGIVFAGNYSTVLLTEHHSHHEAQLATFIMGVCKWVAILVSTGFVDRMGRRPLLLSSCALMGISYVAWALQSELAQGDLIFVTVVLALNVTAFSIGLGPLNYVIPAEVWPLEYRAEGVAAAQLTCRMTEALVAFGVLPLLSLLDGQLWTIAAMFAATCTAGTIFFAICFQETKQQFLERVYTE